MYMLIEKQRNLKGWRVGKVKLTSSGAIMPPYACASMATNVMVTIGQLAWLAAHESVM